MLLFCVGIPEVHYRFLSHHSFSSLYFFFPSSSDVSFKFPPSFTSHSLLPLTEFYIKNSWKKIRHHGLHRTRLEGDQHDPPARCEFHPPARFLPRLRASSLRICRYPAIETTTIHGAAIMSSSTELAGRPQ